jgi:hypothetical protein
VSTFSPGSKCQAWWQIQKEHEGTYFTTFTSPVFLRR